MGFVKELEILINKYSKEGVSSTPDFILASYLNDCMNAYNKATVWKEKWYSTDGVPANERKTGPIV
jgi:hypothetical protein